jgi:cytoskeleton protein RodZ
MAEIGITLRETRMRNRVDIGDVEAATKIRAKYLRALENEEWDLLPGPTFVKTFLRTYAEYLELDPKPLIEEYKQRYERPSPTELAPFGTSLGGRRERRRNRGPIISPGVILALGLVLLVGALWIIGTVWDENGGDDSAGEPNRVQSPNTTPTPTPTPSQSGRGTTPSRVSLTVVPTGTVYVCLVDARGRRLLDGATLGEGQRRGPFRGRRFRVTFGNGAARMRINGQAVNVPDRSDPVGYELTPGKRRELGENARPTCS